MLPKAAVAIAGALVASCVRQYEPPDVREPHAIVRVRVVYHGAPGPQLEEHVRLNGRKIAMPEFRNLRNVPVTEPVRVRPGNSEWTFDADFYHLESSRESRSVYDSSSKTYRTEYHTVTKAVSDSICSARLGHPVVVGDMYLVQYDFFGNQRCAARCFEQAAQVDGSFRMIPCGGRPLAWASAAPAPIRTGPPAIPAVQAAGPAASSPGFKPLNGSTWSIAVPVGWHVVPVSAQTPQAELLVRAPVPVGDRSANVSVLLQAFDGDGPAFASAMHQALGRVATVEQVRHAVAGTLAAVDIESTWTRPPPAYRTLQRYVAARGQGYIVTCAGSYAAFENLRPLCSRILDTFRVQEGP